MTERAGTSRRDTGRHGEDVTARWYLDHGYELLDRNWRCREGELDLVVRCDRTVVFCEVKTRTSDRFGTGSESVSPAKCRRIRRLAGRWLAEGGSRRLGLGGTVGVRFDVASLTAGILEVTEDAF
ncbi:MAG: YraN family protein [Acidimicrobiales bacterium]